MSKKEPHVKLEDDHKHNNTKVKKVLTTKYNMAQLKMITVFDTWVDDELDTLTKGANNVEIDFEEWDLCEKSKRKALLESKLTSIPDSPARKKFVDEYNKKAEVVINMIHSLPTSRD